MDAIRYDVYQPNPALAESVIVAPQPEELLQIVEPAWLTDNPI
jgi:hypothetical protein